MVVKQGATLKLSPKLKHQADSRAAELDLSFSEYLRCLIQKDVEQQTIAKLIRQIKAEGYTVEVSEGQYKLKKGDKK